MPTRTHHTTRSWPRHSTSVVTPTSETRYTSAGAQWRRAPQASATSGTHEGVRDPSMIDQVLAPGAGRPRGRLQQQLGPVRGVPGDRADPSRCRQLATGDGATQRGAHQGMGQVVHDVLKASITLAGALAGR